MRRIFLSVRLIESSRSDELYVIGSDELKLQDENNEKNIFYVLLFNSTLNSN